MYATPCIILLLFIVIIYTYVSYHTKWAATAAAIQQIWSGNCRLSCRRSEFSHYSGYSGEFGEKAKSTTISDPSDSAISTPVEGSQSKTDTSVGPSSKCVCASCPCELVDKALKTCNPAMNLYSKSIAAFSNYYYSFIEWITEMYTYYSRRGRRTVEFQRESQLVTTKEFISKSNKDRQLPSALPAGKEDKPSSSKDKDNEKSNRLNLDKKKSQKGMDSTSLDSCIKCSEKGETCPKHCIKLRNEIEDH